MAKNLIAPRFEPAVAFHQPEPGPFEFGIDTLTVADLMSAPATWDIVREKAAWLVRMVENESAKPFLSVTTMRDAAGAVKPYVPFDVAPSLLATDAALKALPRSQWPTHVR